MARPPNPYTKLPGRGLRKSAFAVTATRCRLWLASDHLLAVESTIAMEEYRRFFFRDIEAFVIRQTAGRQIWNWVWLVLAALVIAPLLYGWQDSGEGGFIVAAIASGAFFGGLILYNTLRGPTCEAHVRTFVQLERLPSLTRLPVARRVFARIRPLIEAAQGGLTAEEVSEAPWMAPDPAQARRQVGGGAPLEVRDRGTYHLALALALLAGAAVGLMLYRQQSEAIATAGIVVNFAGFLTCVVALIRQRDYLVTAGLRLFAKLTLGYFILGFIVGMVFGGIYAVRHEGQSVLTGLEIIGEPGFAETVAASAGLSAVLGCYGLLEYFRSRGRESRGAV